MGIAKTFHLILLIIFISLSLINFNQEQVSAIKQSSDYLAEYKQNPIWSESLPTDGQALFTELTSLYPFYFFQYVHSQDGSHNYTHGQLKPEIDDPITALFVQNLEDIRSLNEGRLQIKLDDSAIAQQTARDFVDYLVNIWSIYLLIAILFSLLVLRLKRALGYASHYLANLSELNFEALSRSKFTGELKPLGIALEKCRSRLHDKFNQMQLHNEKLNKEAFQDPITLFSTRAKFTEKLDQLAKPGKSNFGVLASIKATELAHINQSQGRLAGDNYLAGIAKCIREALGDLKQIECFRISSVDFAIFIPNLLLKDAQPELKALKTQFDEFQKTLDVGSVAHIGLVPYQQEDEPLSLLYQADSAVSIAQTKGPNSYHIQEQLGVEQSFGDDHWRRAIEDIINRRAVNFQMQDIHPCRGAEKVYRELFACFYSNDGKFLPTATVIAMAERHSLSLELDKVIILRCFKLLLDNPGLEGSFGINISSHSMTQAHFVAWIKALFLKHRNIASKVVLEVNEAGMQANIQQAHQFVREMHSVGARVCVERFGLGFTSFKFFKEVRPDFIKLDGSYTQHIDINDNNLFFVKMVVDVARKQSVKVIATCVEQQTEKLALEQLLVDGLQGYYIGKPKPIVMGNEQSAVKQM
ncbi:GGDEF domain-containing protein [Shewanella sp. AS1]|uniref:EAL domain-containing protein n=1 Tax=Shewanella sp. AS1 TaxID=2907626 RepID=UPI001F3A07B3|nr:GGDEF domain-containing protein [Shewanella sp. AS1]MCE9678778.1 GGDEF domain-containing protein [Shewanella sp. AS1]